MIYISESLFYRGKARNASEMIKVNELFSGIGAFRKALENLEIPHEIVRNL